MDVSHDIVSQRLVDAPLCTLYALDFFISRGAFTVAEEIQRFLGQKVTAQLYKKTDGSPSVLLRSAIFNLKRYFMKNEHKKDGIRDDLEISLAHLVESAPEARKKASFQQFLISFLSCRLLGLLLEDPPNRHLFLEEYDAIFNHKSKNEVYLGKHLKKSSRKALRDALAQFADADDDDIDFSRAAKLFKRYSSQVAKDVHEALDPILLGLGQGPLFELLLPVQRRLEHGGYETDLSSSDSDEPVPRHKARTPHRKSLATSYTPSSRALRTPSSSHMSGLASVLAAATSSSKSVKKKSERSTPQRRLRLVSSSESGSSSSESSSQETENRRKQQRLEKRQEALSHPISTPVSRRLTKPSTPVSRSVARTNQPRQPLDDDDEDDTVMRFTPARPAASGPASRRESDFFATQYDFGQNDVRIDQNEHEYTTTAFGDTTDSIEPMNTSINVANEDLAPASRATAVSGSAVGVSTTTSIGASTPSRAAATAKPTAASNGMDISEVENTTVAAGATNGTVRNATRPGKRHGSQLVEVADDEPLGPNPAKRVSEGVEASSNGTNPPAAASPATADAERPKQRTRTPFSIEEDAFLRECYKKYGNKYANIFYAGQARGLYIDRTQVSLKDRIRNLSKHETLVPGREAIPKNEARFFRPLPPRPHSVNLSAEDVADSIERGDAMPTSTAKTTTAKASSSKIVTRSSLCASKTRKTPTRRTRDEDSYESEVIDFTDEEEETDLGLKSDDEKHDNEDTSEDESDSDESDSDEPYKLDDDLLGLVPDHVVRPRVASPHASPNKRKPASKHKSDEEPKSTKGNKSDDEQESDEPNDHNSDEDKSDDESLVLTTSQKAKVASLPKTIAAKKSTAIVIRTTKNSTNQSIVTKPTSTKRGKKISKKPITYPPKEPLVESSSESDDDSHLPAPTQRTSVRIASRPATRSSKTSS